MIGRRIEIAFIQLQRFEDVLVDIDFVVVARQELDHPAQEDDAGVGVAPFGARLEFDLGVGKHGYELLPAPGFVRLPRLVLPGPGRGSKTGAVSEEMLDRDLAHVAEWIIDLAKLGDVFDDRVVQGQEAPVTQLHDGDPGQRLRNRGPVVDGAFVCGNVPLFIGEPERDLVHDLVVVEEENRAADDTRVGQALFIEGVEFVARFLQFFRRGGRTGSRQRCEAQSSQAEDKESRGDVSFVHWTSRGRPQLMMSYRKKNANFCEHLHYHI